MNAVEALARPLKAADPPELIVRRIHDVLERHGASIPVRLWDGTELGRPGAAYRLVLVHPWSLRAMLVPPNDLSAGEAYVHGAVDVEGSMVAALHDAARLRHAASLSGLEWAGLGRDLLSLPRPPERERGHRRRLTGEPHTKERDKQAVQSHYDVSNAFYRLFLDERLVYSCAYFTDDDAGPDEDRAALDRAQRRKLDLICRKLGLRPGQRLLDIGCGWGALVLHAATHYGVWAVGITLSEPQAELSRERVEHAGLSEQVEIRVQDYRDTVGPFDAVASVGMFEHVGAERFETYFARAYELTAAGGRFLNHAITTGRRRGVCDVSSHVSFVGTHVFPDGALVPAHVAVRLMEQAGFELLDVQQLRPHYGRTLRHWIHRLERAADQARATAGEATYRTWRAYMSGSVVGFETNDLGVVQVLGSKGATDVPLGRAWMEPTT